MPCSGILALFTGSAESPVSGFRKWLVLQSRGHNTEDEKPGRRGLGSPVFPHQLSPVLHLPLNFLPGRDVLKFTPSETPHSQLFWLRSWCPQLPAIRRGPQPRTFREMSMSPSKSSTDRWNWADRQVLVTPWKPLMAGWLLECQRTDSLALAACSPVFSLTQNMPPSPLLGPGILASGFLLKLRW